MAGREPLARTIRRSLLLTLVTGLVSGVLFMNWQHPSWLSFGLSTFFASTYANLIGLPATLLFRTLGPRLRGRRALTQWLTYIGVLFGLTAAGCLVAGLV